MDTRSPVRFVVLLLALLLAASPAYSQDSSDSEIIQLTCSATAQSIEGDAGTTAFVSCPASCAPGTTWGTDIYTDDSSICTAARHAGVIGGTGGVLQVEILPGQESYEGTARHGIETFDYASWGRSFAVLPLEDNESRLECLAGIDAAIARLQETRTLASAGDPAAGDALLDAREDLDSLISVCAEAEAPAETSEGGLEYVIEAPEGLFSFVIPAEWFVREFDGRNALISNVESQLAYDPMGGEQPEVAPGEALIIAGLIDRAYYNLTNLAPDASPSALLSVLAELTTGGEMTLVETNDLTIAGREAAELVLSDAERNIVFLMVDMGQGEDGRLYGQVVLVTPSGELEAFRQTAHDLASTFSLSGP